MSIDTTDNRQLENFNNQVKNILEAVLAFANLDFEQKADLRGECEQLDSLSAGINMLGEELRAKVVQLNEREMLIKEVHHRVKNNLQIVSSILNLQSSVSNDSQIASKLNDCQERIASMALVHEQLYNSNNLSELEINEYFGSLCQRMQKSFSQGKASIQFNGLDESLFISSDTLIPIGLIASEIIMNSFKHAFHDRTSGTIQVELNKQDKQLIVSFQDNGIGFNTQFDFEETQSLGLALVYSLTEQINAQIQFSNHNGTHIQLILDHCN